MEQAGQALNCWSCRLNITVLYQTVPFIGQLRHYPRCHYFYIFIKKKTFASKAMQERGNLNIFEEFPFDYSIKCNFSRSTFVETAERKVRYY